jgi:REP element-mobilizing transposase RayT
MQGNLNMTYWRLHYHIIWATKDRQPILTPCLEKMFYGVIYRKAEKLGLKVHAAGNVDDHVHIVLSIPPKLAVADCVRYLKSASAFAIITWIGAMVNSSGRIWSFDYRRTILG